MKYYIIAGERSGDLHASNLMKEILTQDQNAEFRFWGGDEMQKVGGVMVKHYREMAFMGFIEVLKNILTIRKYIDECKKDIKAYQPDVVILVDYAGFNLRIAPYVKSLGIKVFYYISPKVWAWNQKRALKIKKNVDQMFVIMHFEKAFYQKYEYEVDYVGNPLFDAIEQFQPNPDFLASNGLSNEKKIIAILPGSRKQELKHMLPKMLEVVDDYPDYQFVVAGVDNLPSEIYAEVRGKGLPIILDQTYDLLSNAHAALVTSGTATLETALFEVPQVVCYKTSRFSYQIAKSLIKVSYISLVNLIADKLIVTELIQNELNKDRVEEELNKLLTKEGRQKVLKDYHEMKEMIKTEGTSKRAAKLMVNYLNE